MYAKESFGGPEQVYDYLGRYVRRIAISNYRLISVSDEQVCFSYRDNSTSPFDRLRKFSGRSLSRP